MTGVARGCFVIIVDAGKLSGWMASGRIVRPLFICDILMLTNARHIDGHVDYKVLDMNKGALCASATKTKDASARSANARTKSEKNIQQGIHSQRVRDHPRLMSERDDRLMIPIPIRAPTPMDALIRRAAVPLLQVPRKLGETRRAAAVALREREERLAMGEDGLEVVAARCGVLSGADLLVDGLQVRAAAVGRRRQWRACVCAAGWTWLVDGQTSGMGYQS